MICYRDMTFCFAPCATVECPRKLTEQVSCDAVLWWGKPGAPIAVANLSEGCPDFVRTEDAP